MQKKEIDDVKDTQNPNNFVTYAQIADPFLEKKNICRLNRKK